ncbi:YecA family protein [Paenibacillus massiliensis]|uniref:YecA family protein n=1 Tax=Paenibacillus massiliensis TaxID=225917 RepID=UPI00036D4D0B|nr:SEC-C domain-containing protein [Paenibacillus massiliensis]
MDINNIKEYLNSFRGDILDQEILIFLNILKENVVSQNNQIIAKEIWCLEQIYKIIHHYLEAFNNLNDKEYYAAWCLFDQIEIRLSYLRRHLSAEETYNLEFYDRIIFQYQMLFPYKYFFSRESVIRKSTCSICGKIASLRDSCGHKVGEIYDGKLCIRRINEAQLLAISVVQNPFDKYAVLFPEGLEYNYSMLENLLEQLSGPYDDWGLETIKEKRIEFVGVGRNAPCPCNSQKKYKLCCHNTVDELFDHHRITIYTDIPKKRIPVKMFNSWK